MHHRKWATPSGARVAATEHPERHFGASLNYLMALSVCVLVALVVLQRPSFAQATVKAIPQNAHSLKLWGGLEMRLGIPDRRRGLRPR